MATLDSVGETLEVGDLVRFQAQGSGTIRRTLGRIVGTIKKNNGDIILQIAPVREVFNVSPSVVERFVKRNDMPAKAEIEHVSHDDHEMERDLA